MEGFSAAQLNACPLTQAAGEEGAALRDMLGWPGEESDKGVASFRALSAGCTSPKPLATSATLAVQTMLFARDTFVLVYV